MPSGVSLVVPLKGVVRSCCACPVSDVSEEQDDSEGRKGFQLRYEKITLVNKKVVALMQTLVRT